MGTTRGSVEPPSWNSGQSHGPSEAVTVKRFPKGSPPDMSPKPDTVTVLTVALPPSGLRRDPGGGSWKPDGSPEWEPDMPVPLPRGII